MDMEVGEIDEADVNYPQPWAFYNNVVLLKALEARGLPTYGARKTWYQQLALHDAKVKKTEGYCPKPEGHAIPPRLYRNYMKSGLQLASCLKQVIIRPFSRQLLKVAGVTAWLDEASTYVIKKTKARSSGAFLKFDTIDKGDAAYFDLKEKLQDHNAEVSHPAFPQERHFDVRNIEDPLEAFMTKDFIKDDYVKRLIVLENLPAELNVDEKLCEIFTTALCTVTFEYQPKSKGIAVLEMPSTEEVDRLIGDENTVEVTIEGGKVYASRYTMRGNQWMEAMKANSLDPSGQSKSHHNDHHDDVAVLSDNDRLEMCREVAVLKQEMADTSNTTEIFGLEKIQRHNELLDKLLALQKPMISDAKRRLEYKLSIPEPWNLVPEPIQALINKSESTHFLRLEGLQEKCVKACGEMETAKTEYQRLVSSILCIEQQLKGEEAANWQARRAKLELEKVLEPKRHDPYKHMQRNSKAAKQGKKAQGSKEKTFSVYDYGNALGGLGSGLGDTPATSEVTSGNSQSEDTTDQYREKVLNEHPKPVGKGRGGKQGNKGKSQNKKVFGSGYGNQGNKTSDDYGQFGRRHKEIEPTQPEKDPFDNNYNSRGGNRGAKSRGRGRGKDGNNWGQNNEDSWKNKRNNSNRGKRSNSHNESRTEGGGGGMGGFDGNDWGSFVGNVFGEVTGGQAGTVVTADSLPVKKRRPGEEDEEVIETSQTQIKKGSKGKDKDPSQADPSIINLMDIETNPGNSRTDSSKKWTDDYNRLRQDILTGSETDDKKQAGKKPEKSPWSGHKFEPVQDDEESESRKAGVKFKVRTKEEAQKGQIRDYNHGRKDDSHRNRRQGGRRENEREREGYRREDVQTTEQPAQQPLEQPMEQPMEQPVTQSPWTGAANMPENPVITKNPALAKLSAIEAVLNEKMRKLQELQRGSMETEMQLMAAAGVPATAGLDMSQLLPGDAGMGLPSVSSHNTMY